MSSHPPPRRRRRLAALVVASTALVTMCSAIGTTPAGAVNAPLVTTDGIGLRIDENAILGPALEAIENEIQPFANQMIYNGALANSPAGTPKSLHVSSNVELGFDFVNAGTSGYPQGGLKVHADILGIEIRYIKDPVWPFADCSIWVRPDTATIDASAKINTALLPNAPLQLNPITATWDDDPSVSSSGVCWTYLIDDFFDSLFSSGGSNSIADNIETELNAQAQDLVNDLWAEHVTPVIASLNEFGITFNQIRTDDHGLIVTANVNASGGLSIPGLGGPFNVTNTPDSGATSNVNTLLAARSEVTATVHPNVVNQFMNALNQALNGNFASPQLPGAAVESFLLPAGTGGAYDDNGWSMAVSVGQPFYTQPTGAGGRPQVRMPQATFSFYNSDYVFGVVPVAVFTGTLSGLDLRTEIRNGTGAWGPYIGSTNAALSGAAFDAGQSSPDAVAKNPSPSGVLPFAKTAVDLFSDTLLTDFLTLAPISVGGINITLCTACARVSGDQRYTEFFNVG